MEPREALAVLRALAESRDHPESYRALAVLDDVVGRLRVVETAAWDVLAHPNYDCHHPGLRAALREPKPKPAPHLS